MAIDPNIALGYKPIQLEQRNPLAEYAQIQNIQTGQLQNQLARQQMEQEQGVINYLGSANLGTPEGISGLNKFGKTGLGYAKLIAEQEANALKNKEMQGKLRDQQMSALGTGLTSVMNNPTDEKLGQAFDRLDATGVDTKKLRDQFGKLTDLPSRIAGINAYVMSHPEGRAALAFVQPKPEKADLYGQTVWLDTNPHSPTYLQPVKLLEDQPLPPAVAAQKRDIARAGASNISMSTEKKYGERFGGLIAEADAGKLTAAEKAPQLAESANRIIGIVQQGNVFTGPAADIKLNIARALNVAGANNQDKIANTESLIAASGQSTLDAIKSAGLGTGQGFTDKDLKFLQGIAGGTIGLTSQTLTELATLQHRAASRSADAWNKRSQQLPKDVLQGTGLSTAPIAVPPLAANKVSGPAAGAIQDGYRFKGGNPADAKSWEKI